MTGVPSKSVARDFAYLEANRARNLAPDVDAEIALASLIDRQADIRPKAIAIIDEDGEIDWSGLQILSNQIANMLLGLGVRQGDAVALNMANSIMFLACTIGITRIGAVAGLINTNLRGAQLVHCVGAIDATVSLVDDDALSAIYKVEQDYLAIAGPRTRIVRLGGAPVGSPGLKDRPWLLDGDALSASASPDTPMPPKPICAGDRALYIFTSGTTGLPKPAVITHRRFLLGASSMSIFAFRARPRDRMYNCLPLYHGTGLMVGAAACFHSGASMVLRKRFSASSLIEDATRNGCNLLVYVGEICRYLLATPAQPDDKRCSLTRAAGNGLRPDIWTAFRNRFGLSRICEFYGAGEGNGGFMNIFNRTGSIGVTAATVRLVHYDVADASVVRGADGFATPVADGEPGLLLIEVNAKDRYDGYRDDRQSQSKLVRDVFQAGDCWFDSGDVLRTMDVGHVYGAVHYQFIDRLGDTFRWKSENVSTNEVAEILAQCEGVDMACVFGVAVPGADGKAGMAALLPSEACQLDLDHFADFCALSLPRYARPLFLRIVRAMPLTGTHKFVRTGFVEDGYDIARVSDPLYCWDITERRYVPLDGARHTHIAEGQSGY
jgi:citronellyl-CoA synthetase